MAWGRGWISTAQLLRNIGADPVERQIWIALAMRNRSL